MKVAISVGHGKYVTGASGIVSEVTEAIKVVGRVTEILKASAGVSVTSFYDETSRNQSDNIAQIVKFHNQLGAELNVSVHFNSFDPATGYVQMNGYKQVPGAMGVEVLYKTSEPLATKLSTAIANASGLKNRGAKYRDNLGFLNQVKNQAVLIEVCFVNSVADVASYNKHFEQICQSIAVGLGAVINPQPEAEVAISQLHQRGIINDPAYWVGAIQADKLPHLGQLMINMAKYVGVNN